MTAHPRRRIRRWWREASSLNRVLWRFAALGVATGLVLAVGAVVVSNTLAEQEALRDATERTEGMARGLAVPFLKDPARHGGAKALAKLDEVMQARISEGGVIHIVLWDRDGRVLWADERQHIGEVYPLSEAAETAMTNLSTVATLPGQSSEHPEIFIPESDLLEVYVGEISRDGERFAFEAHLPPDRIAADRAAVLPKLLGISLGSLLLFFAAAVPLALSLARRVDEAQRQRIEALDRSVASWRHQRRLLAQDLHDGVIQDLAALGYGLAVLDARAPTDETSALVLKELRTSALHAETSLRSIVRDLTPRRLVGEGLPLAAAELVEGYRTDGRTVDLVLSPELDFPEGTGTLAFRLLREGLRNVEKHTDADRVRVELRPRTDGTALEVEITDDGSSPADAHALRSGQGLRLLADTIAEAGGFVQLGPAEGVGTRLLAVIPLVGAEPGRP